MGLGQLLTRNRRGRGDEEHRTAGAHFETILLNAGENGWSPAYRYQGGMRIPGAWRCAVLLSDLLGQVPWQAYRNYGAGPIEKLDPVPLLLDQPNPPDTRMTTFSSWALDLIWEGNAIGIVAARNAYGWPTAAYAVPASMVGVRRVTEHIWSNLPIGAIEYQVGSLVYEPQDIIHIKGPCEPGALRGMGVLEAHLSTLDLSRDLQRQARTMARSDGVPTGVLKSSNPDLTTEEAKKLKQAWMEAQRDRSVAVLNSATEFETLAWKPEELQLVQARKFTLHELALIFGVPLSMLGVETSNRTYRNDDTESLNLIKFSLSGHLGRFEQTLSGHLPRGTWVKANLDWVLRSDTLARYEAHKIGIDAGFLTKDEVREWEDLPPLPPEEQVLPPIRVPAMAGQPPLAIEGGA